MFTPGFYARQEQALAQNKAYRDLYGSAPAMLDGSQEIDKFYTFDEKGHIMAVTTSKDTDKLQPVVEETFQKVFVFFGAWTAALNRAGKTLFDYEAVRVIISSSGFFINTGMEKRTFSSETTSASLDTSIIQGVLGSSITGGGMAIAKRVLATIGTAITASHQKQDTKKEISDVLFICESLMGIPIVTVSLYHTKLEQYSWVAKTNCASISRQKISFEFAADDFLFVDPTFINKFSKDFEGSPDYDKLIEKLAGYIK